ncbi:MAG: NYN domain-containing protein [Candidatus Parcubacteria bacterium]|nr:MAG: NYN domain-containing protein [Candidatus Parcubacteria bacterium]
MNPLARPDQRVSVFIDTQNIYHSSKNLYDSKVDFKRLVDILVGERSLIKVMAYVIRSEFTPKEIDFFEALINQGIHLRIKDLQIYPDGSKKADWDIGIAVDVVRFSHLVDVIILVTGDGDFLPLVEYLQNQGKQVEVAGFSQTTSARLKEIADFYHDLDEIASFILI